MDTIRQTSDGRFTIRSSAQSTANGEFWANFVVVENGDVGEVEVHRSQIEAFSTAEMASEAGLVAAQTWLDTHISSA